MRTTIELKKEIIVKFAEQYNMEKSMISNFLKNSESIMAADAKEEVMIVHNKQRLQVIDEVEKLIRTSISWSIFRDMQHNASS